MLGTFKLIWTQSSNLIQKGGLKTIEECGYRVWARISRSFKIISKISRKLRSAANHNASRVILKPIYPHKLLLFPSPGYLKR
jgi:hypothetical protein